MAYLSKQQVSDILANAPAGTDKTKIIQLLVAQGNELEGYSQPLTNKDGLVKSFVKGLADPFLRLGATANALGTSKMLGGPGANMTPQPSPLGPIKPISTIKEATGVGAELAGYATGNPIAAGSLFSAGGALTQNKDLKSVAKDAAIGAAVGSAGALIGKGVSKLASYLIDVAPESLMNHAVKPTLDELKKNIKYGTPTLGKQLVNEGVTGNTKALLKIADEQLTTNEAALQTLLEQSDGVVTKQSILKYAEPTLQKLQETPGAKADAKQLLEIFNDMPDEVPVAKANEIKRNIYDQIRKVAYRFDPSLSKEKAALKLMASGLKTEIENQSGDPATVALLNQKLSIYGRLEDRVVDQLARANRNQIVKMGDAFLAGIGIEHPLALATLLTKHAAESPGVLTRTAVGLNKLSGVTSGPVGKALKTAGKKILVSTPANLNRYQDQ